MSVDRVRFLYRKTWHRVRSSDPGKTVCGRGLDGSERYNGRFLQGDRWCGKCYQR